MNKVVLIVLAGIFLRIILSFTTFHPDLLAFQLGGRLVGEGKILNLYDYSSQAAVFNYPPMIYWFFGLFSFLGEILWLWKLPYLIFDLLLGLILFKLVKEKKALILGFWMFNPISLYATYMIGQFDIIPTFFTILSVFFAAKNRFYWAALALGFGIAFKLYPVFLLIPLIISGKTFLDKIKIGLLAILPYILSVLPYLQSSSFRETALFANQSAKSLYAGIPVSGGEAILLFPASLIIFYLLIWNKNLDKLLIWKIYLIPLLLFFIFTHYHPQWLIWAVPFLVLDLMYGNFKNLLPVLLIGLAWFVSLFFFDPSLTLGIFIPHASSIWSLLNLQPDYNFSRSIIQTIFASGALYLIIKNFPRKIND
ncbi:DUF2029 domain-containing protein [Candidatus Daviesbacteria bacterium]|nr:DUF2029 domain-containing protein [Candidatus Daviesbacteria bacterium]